jgi:choline dehydrogenase-like flavoprotein
VTARSADVLVIGSGAGGATTAAVLAEGGRSVTVLEEGPTIEPGAVEPFSLEELASSYRHRGSSAALGAPPVAYAEGCCVGGSTEVNSGLWNRLPAALGERWRQERGLAEFTPAVLDRYADRVEGWLGIGPVPGGLPPSSAVLERGAQVLGWRHEEFPRAFRYDGRGRGTKQTMSRTVLPRAVEAGAEVIAGMRVQRVVIEGGRAVAVEAVRTHPDGSREPVTVVADQVVVCGGAVQTPALLQRSGLRRGIGPGLKVHPTVKVVARVPEVLDHDDVPMERITEFAPSIAIGGSASRRGHLGLALADAGVTDPRGLLDDWEHRFVYYACIRSDAGGRVRALPGVASPLVTYRLTDADLSRLARGLVHLGEALFAAGATELHASATRAPVARSVADLGAWWDALDRRRANLMTVHLTSSVRMTERPGEGGVDSFGAVRGIDNLRVSDASILPEAPGVNPQAAIMTLAARNADHLLAAR